MSEPLDIVLLIIVFLGLVGTMAPSLPGTGIIMIGAISHALLKRPAGGG